MLMLHIRSHIYNILSYFVSSVVLTLGIPVILINPAFMNRYHRFWSNSMSFLMKHIIGVEFEVIGNSVLPEKCIVACKHQSAWETILALTFCRNCSMVAKEELTKVPVYGFHLKKTAIIVTRSEGMKALKKLVLDCKRALEQERPVFIYPEGTRALPGEKARYQSGIAALYAALNVPVVPVALNSGWFFPKRKIVKYPGKITVQFLPPIEPGLSRKEFMDKLEWSIEDACKKLDEDAKKQLKKYKL